MGGTTAADQAAADAVVAAEPTRRLFSYNGQRPGAGSCATEDDGVALREQPWGQYKKKIDRWFWWEATYYDDNQQGLGTVDLFNSADTFGTATERSDRTAPSAGPTAMASSCTRAPTPCSRRARTASPVPSRACV